MSIETALQIGVGGLSVAVTTLFGLFVGGYKRLSKKLDECEKDREELWKALSHRR